MSLKKMEIYSDCILCHIGCFEIFVFLITRVSCICLPLHWEGALLEGKMLSEESKFFRPNSSFYK